MIFYYIFVAFLGIFVVVFLGGCILALVQHRRQSLQQRLEQARRDLLEKETKTGVSGLHSGAYSKITKEMLCDIAGEEGFRLTGKTERVLDFQREIARGDGCVNPEAVSGRRFELGPDLGDKRQRKELNQSLEAISEGSSTLTLRRDQLGALSKAEILEAARERGWALQDEEIADNEWRLVLRRENAARDEHTGSVR